MSPSRGNPTLKVRLEPELVEETNKVFPTVKGRSGGIALALRRLLYLALDKPMPRQFGEIGRAKAVDGLEDLLREVEPMPFDSSKADLLRIGARKLLAMSDDAVDVVRLRAVLGRLHLWETPLTDNERKKS